MIEMIKARSIESKERITFAITTIVITVFTMAFADALVKYISSRMTLWQIFVLRSSIVILAIHSVIVFGYFRDLRPKFLGWTILRSVLLVMMYIAIYAGAPILNLSTIAASLYTGPLFTTLFSALVIGEPVSKARWIAIVLGFCGVLFIIRPGSDAFSPAAVIPVAAAVFYALAAIITRSKCAQEKPIVLALGLNYALLIAGTVASVGLLGLQLSPMSQKIYPFLIGNWVPMESREWEVIIVLAILIAGIGVGLAKAYQAGPPAVIATFDYSYLIFACFWGFVFFGDVPGTFSFIGIALILCSGGIVLGSSMIEKAN